MSIADWVAVTGAVAVLLTALVGAAAFLVGRGKGRAETQLLQAQARKAIAEADQVDATTALEKIAGDISQRLDRVDSRMDALSEQMRTVQHEVTPNHGGSMKDALRRVEQGQAQQTEMIRSQGHQLGEMKRDLSDERAERRQDAEIARASDERDAAEHQRIWAALDACPHRQSRE